MGCVCVCVEGVEGVVLHSELATIYGYLLQLQSTICEHRDDGRSGGVFRSYQVLKVGHTHTHTQL